ncbi:hypothetical protein TUM4641_31790 [Shewanella morhuae]|nr:hypothetical protein TUM4641_31790 [Shewanella morhuae]
MKKAFGVIRLSRQTQTNHYPNAMTIFNGIHMNTAIGVAYKPFHDLLCKEVFSDFHSGGCVLSNGLILTRTRP